jgi:hypothetical protein
LFEGQFLEFDTCPLLDDGSGRRYYTPSLPDCELVPKVPVDALSDEELLLLAEALADTTDVVFDEESSPSGSSGSLTYFANMNLSKRWKLWSGRLSYSRQESDSLGVGTNTVADVVAGSLAWNPSPRWSANMRISFTRYSSATDSFRTVWVLKEATDEPLFGDSGFFPGTAMQTETVTALEVDSDAYVDNLSLGLNASYRLTKRATLHGNISYFDSSSGGGVGVGRDYERITVNLGVHYSFDPIPF